ncbi:MAG: aromatic amino acid lyase [Verrucomicrobium sp.]|nr:aromatic amino acid lyase [Verrucomicrobium sp.]
MIVLDGSSLTIEEVVAVARDRRPVSFVPLAEKRVEQARQVVLQAAQGEQPHYGINTGVGRNFDRRIPVGEIEGFNRKLLHSHAVGLPPWATDEETRAALLVRLNTALLGRAGLSVQAVRLYRDFLNHGIHPLVPKRGSVGVCDIGCLASIGLAMMGEGTVRVEGVEKPALQALAEKGLSPLRLGAKEGLAIVSSNSLSVGLAALRLEEAGRLLEALDAIYALSLEAWQAELSPLDARFDASHASPGSRASAVRVRSFLRGGALERRPASDRIHEPLSFRSAFHIHGAARDALEWAQASLTSRLNTADDNPAVFWETGEIVASAASIDLSGTLAVESLGLALSHASRAVTARLRHFEEDRPHGLPRFLAPNPETLAFATIQKTFAALDAHIRSQAAPVSADFSPLAGNMEDIGTNSVLVLERLEAILDSFWSLAAIELLHAAQAVDLLPPFALGTGTARLHAALRARVPMLAHDRPLTPDILEARAVLRQLSSDLSPSFPYESNLPDHFGKPIALQRLAAGSVAQAA